MKFQNITGHIIPMTRDLEDQIMAALPASLKNWVLYEAPSDYDVRGIYQVWREGMSEETILKTLNNTAQEKTRQTYGAMHPSLPHIRRQFAQGQNPYKDRAENLRKAA